MQNKTRNKICVLGRKENAGTTKHCRSLLFAVRIVLKDTLAYICLHLVEHPLDAGNLSLIWPPSDTVIAIKRHKAELIWRVLIVIVSEFPATLWVGARTICDWMFGLIESPILVSWIARSWRLLGGRHRCIVLLPHPNRRRLRRDFGGNLDDDPEWNAAVRGKLPRRRGRQDGDADVFRQQGPALEIHPARKLGECRWRMSHDQRSRRPISAAEHIGLRP